MPDCLSSRSPGQRGLHRHVRCPGLGLGPAGLGRDREEPDLAQAADIAPAPGAQAGQFHVPGHCASQVDGGVVDVGVQAGRLAELGYIGDLCPGGPVRGDLDPGLLDAVPHDLLHGLVGVPDPHLVELADPVEFVLDPGRLGAGLATDPHVGDGDRVLVAGIQTGAVDGLGRSHGGTHGAGGRGRRGRDRIGVGLHGEAPDLALVGTRLVRGIDLVDPPVVGCAELEVARVVRGIALVLADQYDARSRPACIVHVLKGRPEIHVVRAGKRPRRPAQGCISQDIGLAIFRTWETG